MFLRRVHVPQASAAHAFDFLLALKPQQKENVALILDLG